VCSKKDSYNGKGGEGGGGSSRVKVGKKSSCAAHGEKKNAGIIEGEGRGFAKGKKGYQLQLWEGHRIPKGRLEKNALLSKKLPRKGQFTSLSREVKSMGCIT